MTDVKDLSPLTGLSKLKKLGLYSVPATDLSPVGNLTELRSIWIYATKCDDYSPLAKLVKLEEFHGGISKFSDMKVVETMPNLTTVRMLREELTNVASLAKCPKLSEVVLESVTGTIDLSIFANMTKLTRLDVEGSTVTNPDAIAKLPALSALDVQKTQGIADFSIFKDLPKLQYIYAKVGQFPPEQIAPYGKKAIIQK